MKAILILFIFSIQLLGKTSFTSDSLTILLPKKIIASGNASFKHDELNISSKQFEYNLDTHKGTFSDSVNLTYLNTALMASYINFDIKTKLIYGQTNIEFKAPQVDASSDSFSIKDESILKLNDNVIIKQNNSQIQSN